MGSALRRLSMWVLLEMRWVSLNQALIRLLKRWGLVAENSSQQHVVLLA